MARDLNVRITGDDRDLRRALGSASRSTSGFGRTFSTTAKLVAAGGVAMGIGVAVGLKKAVTSSVEFEGAMRNVNTIARLGEKQLGSLTKEVLSLAGPTAQAPKVLAAGLYDIVSSGFKAKDATKILAVSAKAASAGLTDTATATRAVTAALNAYHLGAKEARKVSDILFQTVNKGVLTFEELAQNMGDLVPAAAPLGVSLEEVGAAIATITLQGVPAAEAATRVKNTMLQLAKPSANLTTLFKEQGFASGEAAVKSLGFAGVLQMLDKATEGNVTKTAKLTPEIRALLGVVGLTGKNLETYNANLASMAQAQEGAGMSAKAFAEQAKGVGFQWQRTKVLLEVLAIRIGDKLLPALRSILEYVNKNWPQIERVMSDVADRVGDAVEGMVDVVRRNFEGIKNAGMAAFGGLKTSVMAVVAFLRTDFGQQLAAGAIAVIAFGRAFVAVKAAIASAQLAMTALTKSPLFLMLLPLAAAVGIVTAKFVQGKIDAAAFDAAMRAAAGSGDALRASLDRLNQSETALESSKLSLVSATRAGETAERAWRVALDSTAEGSPAREAAYLAYRQSLNDIKAAQDGVKSAVLEHKKAEQERTTQLTQGIAKIRELTVAGSGYEKGSLSAAVATVRFGDGLATLAGESRKAAREAKELGDEAGVRAARKVSILAGVARDLTKELGRIPTMQEIIAEAKVRGLSLFYGNLDKVQQAIDAGALQAERGGRRLGANVMSGAAAGVWGGLGALQSAINGALQQAIANADVPGASPPESAGAKFLGRPIIEGAARGVKEKKKMLALALGIEVKDAIATAKQIAAFAKEVGWKLALEAAAGLSQRTPSWIEQARAFTSAAIEASKQRILEAREAMAQAWSSLADAGLAAFDERLSKGLAAIDAKWAERLKKLTPSEQALADMESGIAKENRDKALADAKAALAAAEAGTPAAEGETPEQATARIKAQQDAIVAARQALVEAERAIARAALEESAKAEREAIEKRAARERKDYEARIARQRKNFLDQLAEIRAGFAAHDLTYKEMMDKIEKLLGKYNINFKRAGRKWADAIADGIRDGIKGVEAAADELAGALADRAEPGSPARKGPLSKFDMYEAGRQFGMEWAAGMASAARAAGEAAAQTVGAAATSYTKGGGFEKPIPKDLGGAGANGITLSDTGAPGSGSGGGMPSWADPEIWAASTAWAEKEGQLENFFRSVETGSFQSNAGLLDQLFRRRSRWAWDWGPRLNRMFDLMRPPEGWSGRQVADYFGLLKTGGTLPSDGFYYGHKGETVVPAMRDRKIGPPARAGGGAPVTVNVYGAVGSPDQIASAIAPAMMEAIRREQRRGRPTITRTV